MKLLNLVQGSPEWHAHRATHFNASEAPAMMGVSKYTSRAELLRLKAGGEAAEVSSFQQQLFDRGHETEASARTLYEQEFGIEFYPACGESEEHPRLAASYDGLEMDEEIGFEHKLWNEELAAAVRAGDLPPMYYWQLEQQFLVNPRLKTIIFMVSDGTAEKREFMEYTPVRGRAKKLLAGWAQFEKDLADYVPETPTAAAVPAPVTALPAITYKLNGLALTSNLTEFRAAAEVLIEKSKLPMESDQDFADRDALCKAFGDAEKRIDVLCEQVLGEIHDVDAFSRGLREIQAQFKAARLAGEKLIEAEKKARKQAVIDAGNKAIFDHIASLSERLGQRVSMPRVVANFEIVAKGKKTLQSIKDAVETEVARVKIEASDIADAIQKNLHILDELAGDRLFLFNDLQQIVGKAHDDFTLLVKNRVSEHEQRERQRAEQSQQQEPARTSQPSEQRPVSSSDPLPKCFVGAGSAFRRNEMATGAVNTATHRAPPGRPSDVDLVNVLADHYRREPEEVIEWLAAFNASKARAELMPF